MRLYFEVKGSEQFIDVLNQLKGQAGIYGKRGPVTGEPGNYTYMGDSMNIYCSLVVADECNCSIGKFWLLIKPTIDG